jgi:SAM-dependent methyltransferase
MAGDAGIAASPGSLIGGMRKQMCASYPYSPEQYEKWYEFHHEEYAAQLDLVASFMPPFRRGLEVGTGTGRFGGPLGIQVGLDPERAMARFTKDACGMEVVQGIAETLPFCADTFDLVMFVQVILLIPDVRESFRESMRVLKPGGWVVIGYVERESTLGRFYATQITRAGGRFWTGEELECLLEECGFLLCHRDALSSGFACMSARKR